MLNKECHRSWWQGNAPVVFSLNTCWDIHVCLRASSRGCRDTVRWLLVHQTYNKDSGQETHLAAVAAVAALPWLWSHLRRKQSLPEAALRRDSLAGCLLNSWSCSCKTTPSCFQRFISFDRQTPAAAMATITPHIRHHPPYPKGFEGGVKSRHEVCARLHGQLNPT